MKIEFLDFLCCPECNSNLSIKITNQYQDKILSGSLNCKNPTCSKIYEITNSIPRFVNSPKYAKSFGDQWNKFALTQIDSSKLNQSEARWETEIGWSSSDLQGKNVVEFGSGAGRFVDIVSKRNANLIIGIDITSAVDAAQNNLADRDNVLFIQGNIFSPPLKQNIFDFAYSIGVLHHTPQPELAFNKLISLLNNKGNIGLSLYEISLFDRPSLNSLKQSLIELLWALNLFRVEFFRFFTTKIPDKIMLYYCIYFIPALHYLNKIPVLRYLRYLFPSTCYKDLPVEWSMCDTNDTYATKIVNMYRHKDIFLWFMRSNIQNIIIHDSISGWVSLTGQIKSNDNINYEKYLNKSELKNTIK